MARPTPRPDEDSGVLTVRDRRVIDRNAARAGHRDLAVVQRRRAPAAVLDIHVRQMGRSGVRGERGVVPLPGRPRRRAVTALRVNRTNVDGRRPRPSPRRSCCRAREGRTPCGRRSKRRANGWFQKRFAFAEIGLLKIPPRSSQAAGSLSSTTSGILTLMIRPWFYWRCARFPPVM